MTTWSTSAPPLPGVLTPSRRLADFLTLTKPEITFNVVLTALVGFLAAAHGSVADQLAAGAIIGMALTVSLYGVNRLGVCTVASCHRVFIDASPGRSRRYCTEHMTAKGNVSTLRRQTASEPGRATPAAS